MCGDGCFDLDESSDHCGACDQPCPGGQACSGGVCECNGNKEFCDGTCVNVNNDPDHCGGCNEACAVGEMCAGGKCK